MIISYQDAGDHLLLSGHYVIPPISHQHTYPPQNLDPGESRSSKFSKTLELEITIPCDVIEMNSAQQSFLNLISWKDTRNCETPFSGLFAHPRPQLMLISTVFTRHSNQLTIQCDPILHHCCLTETKLVYQEKESTRWYKRKYQKSKHDTTTGPNLLSIKSETLIYSRNITDN